MTEEQKQMQLNYAVNYSWMRFKVDAENLSQIIKTRNKKITGILAITKGGLIPAYFIAKKLGINIVKTLCISSYKDKKRGGITHHKIDGFSEEIKNPENWLVIDDIADSGATLNFVRKLYPKIKTATIWTKENINKPDYYPPANLAKSWIRFPWE